MYCDVYAFGDKVLQKQLQNNICKELAPEQPFNQKSDNFLYLEKIHSVVISSLMDEEIMGQTEAVGTLQLYNRKYSEITQDDLARVSFIRKLIGSILIKCEYYSITL